VSSDDWRPHGLTSYLFLHIAMAASVFGALRVPARRSGSISLSTLASCSKARPASRGFATSRIARSAAPEGASAPKSGSNLPLLLGVGALVAGGGVYWLLNSDSDAAKTAASGAKGAAQVAKVAANFVPTKEDYEKVRGRPVTLSPVAYWLFVIQVYQKIASTLDAEDYDGTRVC